MAVSVRRLSRNIKKDYRISLIAGSDGLDNQVNWVHMIEDYDVAEFLRGKELILTTGIGNLNTVDNLLKFINMLCESNASGLMINLGPYIESVPRPVIDYCNSKKMPLFTVPWEVKLVDLTRQFCQMIIESEAKEKSLTSLVKDYLFKPADREKLYADLTRNGFSQHLNYCVINVGLEGNDGSETDNKVMEVLHETMEREITKRTNDYVIFKNEQNYVLITAGINTNTIRDFVESVSEKTIGSHKKIYIAVSTNKDNLMALPANFELSKKMSKLGKGLEESPLYYEDLGMYKILLSVSEDKTMKDYVKSVVGPVLEYDEQNGSDYFDFIKMYLQNGASVQQAANHMYVHRNTIHYKIGKIKEIAGINLTDIDDLLKVALCLKILKMK